VTLSQIKALLKAKTIYEGMGGLIDVKIVKASDLMSDVLAFSEPGKLLLTGLTNNNAIRTCDIAGISVIVFVRGKRPSQATVELAKKCKIAVLITQLSMFDACGILYTQGLRGVQIPQSPK
jgi:hypothetical protein